MKHDRDSSFGFAHPDRDTTDWQGDKLSHAPTPREVFAQIGRVILVCLALALFARLLVAVVGVY